MKQRTSACSKTTAQRVDFVDGRARGAVVRGLTSRRRQRMHAEIAHRLVKATPDDPTAIAEIAEQMDRAGTEGDPAVLARTARVAADEALALGMWNDADAVLRGRAPDRFARRHRASGAEAPAAIAAYHCNDPRAASHADRAVELGRRAGDFRIWGESALIRSRIEFG